MAIFRFNVDLFHMANEGFKTANIAKLAVLNGPAGMKTLQGKLKQAKKAKKVPFSSAKSACGPIGTSGFSYQIDSIELHLP